MRYSKNSAYRKPVAVMPVSKKKKITKQCLKKAGKKKTHLNSRLAK